MNFRTSIQKNLKASTGFCRCWHQRGSSFCWFVGHDSPWFIVVSSAIGDNTSNQQIKPSLLYHFTKCRSSNVEQMFSVASGSKGGNGSFSHFKFGLSTSSRWSEDRSPISEQAGAEMAAVLFDSKHISWMSSLFALWNQLRGQRSGVLALPVNVYWLSTVSIGRAAQRRWKPEWMSEWRLDLVASKFLNVCSAQRRLRTDEGQTARPSV